MAYRIRFYMDMNAREAMHLIELRTAPQGHPAYRRICQAMHTLIAEQAGHRVIADAMKFVDHSAVELERLKAERAAEKSARDPHRRLEQETRRLGGQISSPILLFKVQFQMRVEVTAPNPAWKLAVRCRGLSNLLLEVADISVLDCRAGDLVAIGYEALGEYGIARRRYFRKNNARGVRTHQVHSFQVNDSEIERHLVFRDYMTAHVEKALVYSDLKQELAARHPYDIDAYMDGKDAFIKEHQAKALAWSRTLRTGTE